MSAGARDNAPGKVSPFNAGAIGAGDTGDAPTATRFWWVRHAPVAHEGRIYGQKDMTCDCSDKASVPAAPSLRRPWTRFYPRKTP